jgi:hypothetical protein
MMACRTGQINMLMKVFWYQHISWCTCLWTLTDASSLLPGHSDSSFAVGSKLRPEQSRNHSVASSKTSYCSPWWTVRPAWVPPPPPVKWVPGLLKQRTPEAYHSSPYSSKVKNEWVCISPPLYTFVSCTGTFYFTVCWKSNTHIHTHTHKDIYIYIHTINQQMHCSDSLLISYSSYMFRRMYVITRELSFMCPAELH